MGTSPETRTISSGPFLVAFASSLSLAVAHGESQLKVVGTVYCDTCRTQFLTHVSKMIPGEIWNPESGRNVKGPTTRLRVKRIALEDTQRGKELCEIVLVESSKPDYQEINRNAFP